MKNLENRIQDKYSQIYSFEKNNDPNRYGYNETLNKLRKDLLELELESLK